MAEVPVVLKVVAGGAVSALRRVNQQAKNLSKRFRETAKSASGITAKLNGLSGVLGRLALAETGRRAIAAAADYQALQQRIALLTSDYGENAAALQVAASAAKTFGLSNREAAGGVADIYARLRPMGVSLEEIETTFRGFNTAAKISGTSAMEASGAFRQLSQALGSGRLQGDEFRSIAEQMPAIMTAIGKEMDRPVGELKKLASEGKITADIVIKSMERIEREGAGKIASIMDNSPVQKMKDLQNQIEELQIAIGQNMIPIALPLTGLLTELLIGFNNLNPAIKGATISILSAAAAAVVIVPALIALKAAAVAAGIALIPLAIASAKIILVAGAIGGIAFALSQVGKEARQAKKEFNWLLTEGTGDDIAKGLAAEVKKLDALMTQTYKGKGFDRTKGRKIKEAQERIAELERQLRIQRGVEERDAELAADAAKMPEAIAKAAADKAKAESRATASIREQNDLLLAKIAGKEEEYLLEAEIQALIEKGGKENEKAIRDAIKKREELKKTVTEVEKMRGLWKEIGAEIKDGIVESVKAAVMGTKSLGEVASNVLNSIANKLMDGAINMLLKGMFSGMPGIGGFLGFANGGRPPVGKPSVVGEKGPEVFVPRSSGTVIPNDEIGGGNSTSIVVNVDASSSEVEGDDNQATELGNMLANAIQAELVRQARPGGLLAR